ncbi:hypothetical protein [Secundilactobacillus kimchicus]|uniref:Uncharacterized protein n=1 Tax=Secundilactobacillus kimchicus JCM 15530 TaxID=1302272 RepID=A0A0R1HWC2_9LACO|nr:hypothetical protein [Secundilactobacillus kimchicus]KRK48164.1 hypothetical protein FC96_GL001900 [Secundilactobacillus kimchicus JCM 15530]MBT9670882.1 hypothetical protein [Secundilactobacillus kimchicus]
MEVTKEQLNQLVDKAVEEKLSAMVDKPKRPREWTKLSQEIENHLSHFGNPDAYQLKNSINTILRIKLHVRNVYQINSSNINEARKIVQGLLNTI